MSRIIDNSNLSLSDALKDSIPASYRFDACVGYFNLRGWRDLRPSLQAMTANSNKDDRPRVRLLVGMAVSPKDQAFASYGRLQAKHANEIGLAQIPDLERRFVEDFVEQLTWQTTSQDQADFADLLSDLKSGFLKVSFAARTPLHAKLYLCHLDGQLPNFRSVVGSSNFTPSGLRRNGELNIEESDAQRGLELAEWFEEKWSDRFTTDVTDQLIDVLEDSWALAPQPTPYEVHLRLAYELSRDARSGNDLDIPSKILKDLLKWQESAVRVATRMLQNHGLAVIGDVVGLGKTLVGLAICASVEESVLIICPKNLENMWNQYIDEYDIPGRVVPLSTVIEDLRSLRRYKLVLIDESHNLRNSNTKRWDSVREYIELNEPLVVLMTATMYNADHLDIADQLKLKLSPDQDLGLRPEALLESLGDQGVFQLAQRTNGKLTTLSAFEQSDKSEDWQRLLGQYLVRRTRSFIKSKYGKTDESGTIYFELPNGDKFSFPVAQAKPLEYVGGPNDPSDALASNENFAAISSMTFARYQPGRYVRDGVVGNTAEEIAVLKDFERGNATSGFIRTTVLKRLASSPKAFVITVEKMLLRGHVMRYALMNDFPVPVGTLDDRAYAFETDGDINEPDEIDLSELSSARLDGSWAQGHTEEDWLKKAESAYRTLNSRRHSRLRWIRSDVFHKSRLLEDLTKDTATLQGILNDHGNWSVDDDTKLRSLATLINDLPAGEKLLVFSEYKDTIDYVYAHLVEMCPNIEIGVVSGSTDDPTLMARRFAPKSNTKLGGLPKGTSELQVLLATDVLSEGQNLQDCAKVLNWDLPWTLIKIVQRAGRVDRVGQASKEIEVLSFLPQEDVDNRIRLLGRLSARLASSREILGGDDNFFLQDFPEDQTSLRGLYDGSAHLIDEEGEVDFGSYAMDIWDQADPKAQKNALALPASIGTTRQSKDNGLALIVHSRVHHANKHPIDVIAVADSAGNQKTITPMDALKLTSSTPDDPAITNAAGFYDAVSDLIDQSIIPAAQDNQMLVHHGLRKKIYDYLISESSATLHGMPASDRCQELAEKLTKFPIYETAKNRLADIYRSRNRLGVESTLEALLEFHDSGKMIDESTTELETLDVVIAMGFEEI